ncbi:Asp23/Gls24 family envelope stress response protein [Kineococcus terrestris]|uniref:Asp23/Gls24 family envelope stress response protein n=1 Tax=Kineococcus terrestris TaxID=2044856 RepID=UPI0034DAE760
MTPPADADAGRDAGVLERLADDLAGAVLAVPGVVRLHAGALGEVATYLPGRRVTGVRLPDAALRGAGPGGPPVEVHVVLGLDAPVREVACDVHAAAAAVLAAAAVPAPVAVHVEDVAAA